ncbi:MAG: formylmethanofuran--tetrahydromethanopterin N-formyltransferase [Gammaproteobacteria bacterium]|nr:formylmethanofuran--tetrahydromethanopterin N-formyltransferase [Gammaproteobacteria bacterium]
MKIKKTEIVDTFAEAFEMWGSRVIITADTLGWARAAAQSMTGFATSVIRCKCEAAVECEIAREDTPDGRPGISVLLFTMAKDNMSARLVDRIGQCVMTCPTTACYNGIPSEDTVPVGGRLRYFGDGYQISKKVGDRKLWRIPVMEGEFVVDDSFGVQPAVGGGNLLIYGPNRSTTLRASLAAADAMKEISGVFLPFPQGVVRSGSKVGSKYKGLIASTNDEYCPTLRGFAPKTQIPDGIEAVYEIVVDGLDEESVAEAMKRGMHTAAEKGATLISAGNYGGDLGKYHFHLNKILEG